MRRGTNSWRKAARRASNHRRLRVESLEDRRLLAAMTTPALTFDAAQHRASSLIVQFRPGISSPGSLAAHLSTEKVNDEWSIAPGMHRVDLDADADWAATLLAYQNDPNVLFAQPDHRVSLLLEPDDPDYSALYGLNNSGQTPFGVDDADIDAPEAWNVTTGSSSTIVAVIDTGVDYNHPDLADNMWTNTEEIAGNRVDDDGNGFVDDVHGYDFANRDGNPMDDHFHGTHVAGTIGAVGNNGIGVVGVNWDVQIMAVKFLDANGGGFESDAIAALNYAVANGAHISNNSWGGLGFSAAFQAALQNAANQGHIFVAAAGNDGWNNDLDPFYPAGYNVSNVVSVAATDDTDELAWFSNYGKLSVDLAAPGVNIYSTFPTTMTGAMQEGGFSRNYESISGTSMATPHVAGVMALVKSIHSEWTHQQIINKVLSSVDFIEGASLTVTGGRLNAAAAVDAPDSNGPRIVATDPSNVAAGTIDHVRLRFSETIAPASISLDDILGFSGPDGPIEILSVVPVVASDRQFDVTFAPQSTLGEYSLSVGSNISDLFGNLLDQDRDGTGGEDPEDYFTTTFEIADNVDLNSTDVPKFVDSLEYFFFGPVTSVIDVPQNIEITDLNLQLYITYFDVEELEIYLESPSGTRVFLVREFDAFGDSFYNTAFDDEASTPIGFGTAPYVGTFRPTQPLSNFDGENAAGTWTLYIEAHLGNILNGQGWLEAWSLAIEGEGGGDPPPPPPPPPPPGNRAPVAADDELSGEINTRVAVPASELLANDFDADGDELSISFVGSPVGGSVSVGADQLVTFTPDADFEGQASFQYIVTDGFLIDTGNVTIQFAPLFQWHNAQLAHDVDKDGEITANDALTVINILNAFGPSGLYFLSSDAEPENFLDVMPDNFVTAADALEVINHLNAFGATTNSMSGGEGEGESSADEIDMALLSLMEGDRSKKSRG
jgi:serine protease